MKNKKLVQKYIALSLLVASQSFQVLAHAEENVASIEPTEQVQSSEQIAASSTEATKEAVQAEGRENTSIETTTSTTTASEEPVMKTVTSSQESTVSSSTTSEESSSESVTKPSNASTEAAMRKEEVVLKPNVDLSVSKTPNNPNSFQINLNKLDDTEEITSVRAAVWTKDRGQDDLKWYDVPFKDVNNQITIQNSAHGNQYGDYIVHVYVTYKKSGRIGRDLGVVTLERPAGLQLIEANFDNYGLNVKINPTPGLNLNNVRLAVWSDEKGQDDLKWHLVNNNGVLRLPYGNLSGFGKYHIHAYSAEIGRMRGLGAQVAIIEKPTFSTTITKKDGSSTVYQLDIKNVPDYITELKIPTWSEHKGQDDIKWYNAKKVSPGHYQLLVDIANHKFDSGKYHTHIYGKATFTKDTVGFGNAGGFTVEEFGKPSANVAVKNLDAQKGTFDVIVSNINAPGALESIKVPVWSDANGQDDLKWYEATKQSDGTYKITVLASNHKFTNGKYHVHTYIQANRKLTFVGSSEVTFNLSPNTGNISISNVNTSNYTFNVSIANANSVLGIKKVKLAVWSDADGQNDLRWYEAYKTSGSNYSATVRLANHQYSNGKYHVHLYYDLNNGKTVGVAPATTNITTPAPRAHIQKELKLLTDQFHSIFSGVGGQKSLYITEAGGVEAILHNDSTQRSASTIKLFIMAAAFAKAERGELNLSQHYTVKSSDIVNASVSLGGSSGVSYTLDEINRFMVETSDNTATNIMIRHIGGIEAVNNEIKKLGYTKTHLQRYMHDPVAINKGLDNYISAQEAGDLIKNMYNRTLLTKKSDDRMIYNLSNNYYPMWLPAQIKGQAYVIDKPGNNGSFGVENDVAVIAKNGRSYAVAVLTQGTGSNGLSLTSRFAQFGQAILNQLKK